MKLRITLSVLFFTFVFLASSYAAIIVQNNTGAVKIYMPDGKQVVVKAGEPMPPIPQGAVITILAGSATINTTGKSTVNVSIGTYTVQVKEGSKINLTLNPDGTMTSTIIAGQALVSRKVEAYENPRLPGVPEIGFTQSMEEISPSR